MAVDENLAARIRTSLALKKGIAEKKMYGGIGFHLNGNMRVGVWKDSLIVRLGEQNIARPDDGPRPIAVNFVRNEGDILQI